MRTGRCRSGSSIGETEVRFDPCRRTCGRASVLLGTRATVCAGPPRQTGRSHPVLARPRVARPSPDGEGVAGRGRAGRPISSLPHSPMATSPSTSRTTKRSLISWRRCRLTSVPCHPGDRVLVLAAGRASASTFGSQSRACNARRCPKRSRWSFVWSIRTGRYPSRSSSGETEVRFDPCRRVCRRVSCAFGNLLYPGQRSGVGHGGSIHA